MSLENHKSAKKEHTTTERSLFFLCNGFPIVSETFVSEQILNALKNYHYVSVHVDYINSKDNYLMENDLFLNENIPRIFVNHRPPEKYAKRLVSAFLLALRHSKKISFFKSINPFIFGFKSLNIRPFYSYSSFLGKPNPTLIHAQFGANGVKAINAKIANVVNCPIVTSFHGYDAHVEPNNIGKFRKYYFNLFKYGDKFIVNGNFLKEQLLELGCPENKIIKIPIGVNLETFKPSAKRTDIDAGTIKFITVGRLINWKNQEFGIRLLRLIRDEGINASYTLIGEGPEEKFLRDLAIQLNLVNHVHFLGSMPNKEIADILPKCHIFLMTSYKDETGRMETQGIVSAEAQACGLPVITLGFGGTADTIMHGVTGYNVSSSSPEDAIKYVRNLINPLKYNELSINARNFILENYDIEVTNRSLIKIYENLITNYR